MSAAPPAPLLSRRQSLGLVVWGALGAGCEARSPPSQGMVATTSGAPAAAPPGPPKEFAGLSDPVALRFYQQRGWTPAWNPDQVAALARGMADARRHALDHVTFTPHDPPGADSVRQDIGQTLAALRYARALACGYIDPGSVEKIFTLRRNEVDLAAGLEQALAGGRLADWLASLPPADDEYKALSDAYVLGSACQAGAVTEKPSAAPDQAAPDQPGSVPAATPPPPLAAPSGDAPSKDAASPPSPGPDANAPKEGAAEAAPAGVAAPAPVPPPGASPRSHVAAPPGERARQLAANLERRRWLARTPPAMRIDVNTAGAFLAYLKPGADPVTTRVVVGKPGHETPSIQASFHRLVANPKWRVPMDIARKEIFPKGSGYLRREHMRVVNGQVVQDSGPHNSLGLVKFDVEDPYAIYLHDTPAKSIFALPDRHKSHGCVRVQDAVGFARRLADERGKRDAFDKALASGKTSDVEIGEAIPVRLLYHTAYADVDGRVTVIADAYGWNERLAAALGFPAAPAPGPGDQPDIDLGP